MQHRRLSQANLTYVGRWDLSRSACSMSHFGGAYLKAAFTGSRVGVLLAKPADLVVKIDQMRETVIESAVGPVNLTPDPLSDGRHQLRIAARHQDDELAVEGLILEAGATTHSPQRLGRQIEFIGDSITLGGKTRLGTSSSFSWLAAEWLGAEHTHIAYSGIALVNGYRYDYVGAPQDGMESRYFLAVQPNSPSPSRPWHFPPPAPDTVVINLGSNDGMLKVPPSLFQERFAAFLGRLRSLHPAATMIVLRPFMGYMENEVRNAALSAGDAHVRFIDTTGWISAEDTFDGDHPTEEGHRKAARLLTGHLSES